MEIISAVEEQVIVLEAQVAHGESDKDIQDTRRRIANLIECINWTKLAKLVDAKCEHIVSKRRAV